MSRSASVLALVVASSVLLLAASLVGILGDDAGSPYAFTSLRGESVEVYGGQGLYQHDGVSKAILFRGFDWANLFVCLPLLAWGMVLRHRGELRGHLLVASVFSYLAYNYLIGVMGNAFNILFLVWTGLFSVGIFGLALALGGIDISAIPRQMRPGFPRRSLAVYMVVLGVFLLVQYLSEIVLAYRSGNPPASLGVYTTLELAALELGIMIPLHLAGAVLLWKKRPLGYVLGILLVFTAFMTFVSLALASLVSYFQYGRGALLDTAVPVVLALVAMGFSVAVFTGVGNEHAGEEAVEQWLQPDGQQVD